MTAHGAERDAAREGAAPAEGRGWLGYALAATALWGVWGAFIEIPEKAGFPASLGYTVWSLTMIPCAAFALGRVGWKVHRGARDIALGASAGLLGAAGQLILFETLRLGPAYLVFPVVALYPLVTVILAYTLLRERVSRRSWTGVALAVVALPMLARQEPSGQAAQTKLWLLLTLAVFLMWGVQGYVFKLANLAMSAESLFFYMMASGVALIPVALAMTDFTQAINWGLSGPWAAVLIQSLNSLGALLLVYAVRYGKAVVVVPMAALAPVLTVLLSLGIYRVIPHPVVITGMVAAAAAMVLMAE